MFAKSGIIAGFATILFTTHAVAHHPGGAGNAGSGGPIVTIPAGTLEEGHAAAAFWYEYVGLGGLSDADLVNAASHHVHAHSIKTIESGVRPSLMA